MSVKEKLEKGIIKECDSCNPCPYKGHQQDAPFCGVYWDSFGENLLDASDVEALLHMGAIQPDSHIK
jgi:hypothetical protein